MNEATGISSSVAIPIGARLLAAEMRDGALRPVDRWTLDGMSLELCKGRDALWLVVRRPSCGGVALRALALPGGIRSIKRVRRGPGEIINLRVRSDIGEHRLVIRLIDGAFPAAHIVATLTPHDDLLVPYLPRDLYPLGADDRVGEAVGHMEAAQRGLNSGLCYLHITDPDFGSLLYFQDLTSLNQWFVATKTKPDGAVGGVWPELGYLPPTPPQSGTPPTNPLPAGRETVVSDLRLVFQQGSVSDERASALRFLQMLSAAYATITHPEPEYRDWPGRAEKTLRDLSTAPSATIRHYGNRYAHPYTGVEYPDSMVQLLLVKALHEWARWTGEPVPLEAEFARGLRKFYDPKLKTLRRYLPNVGDDKDKDAVDSWYLYHPLMNLGRLALDGDRRAAGLFRDALGFAIEAAHHFRYVWPIQFRVTDFSIITKARNPEPLGQTDVGGLYAYVMLQAHRLTDDPLYLAEARAAIDAARGMQFELNYQANLTAWGAAACLRLWRMTGETLYRELCYVYLASFFHNSAIWESEIGHARHFSNFLGVTALHDAPYMALYECFDSFTAFEDVLRDGGPDFDPAARLLISEYCRYALHRAWFYYPDALPKESLATEIRNGWIDPALSFPLEDLYPDGQEAGQVGQEIYGAGAAFAFATRSHHQIADAPFLLFCDHFILRLEQHGGGILTFETGGGDGCTASLSLIRLARRQFGKIRVTNGDGKLLRPHHRETDRIDYRVAARGKITINWSVREDVS